MLAQNYVILDSQISTGGRVESQSWSRILCIAPYSKDLFQYKDN